MIKTTRTQRRIAKQRIEIIAARGKEQIDRKMSELTLVGRTTVSSYGKAQELKHDFDESHKLLHRKVYITPAANGFILQVVEDHPEEQLDHCSEVLANVIFMEEHGLNSNELFGGSGRFGAGRGERGYHGKHTVHPNREGGSW